MKAGMIVATMLLAAGSALAETRVSVGIHVGGGYGYPPPPVYVYEPPCPGPGYLWVPGYYYGVGPRYSWHAGYWAPPRHRGWYGRAYRGHDAWGGRYRGRMEYRGRDDRDWGRDRDRGDRRGHRR